MGPRCDQALRLTSDPLLPPTRLGTRTIRTSDPPEIVAEPGPPDVEAPSGTADLRTASRPTGGLQRTSAQTDKVGIPCSSSCDKAKNPSRLGRQPMTNSMKSRTGSAPVDEETGSGARTSGHRPKAPSTPLLGGKRTPRTWPAGNGDDRRCRPRSGPSRSPLAGDD